MNKVHIKFKLRSDRSNSNGLYPIYMYANINGKVRYFSLNHSVPPKAWNEKKQEVSITVANWRTINDDISRYRSSAERLRIATDENNEMISLFQFESVFRGGCKNSIDFYSFLDEYIKLISTTYAAATIKMYKSQVQKLKRFRSELKFNEITPFFWKHYNSYLISLKNNENTRWKAFSTIKAVINRAIEYGIIKTDPLKGVNVKKSQGSRLYLTCDELKRLESLLINPLKSSLKIVLRYFLFSCYTAMRFSDVKNLRHSNVFLNGENPYLRFLQQKTSSTLIIPLGKKSLEYMPEKGLPNDPVFKMYCNQVTNRLLKEIMKLAEINKTISYHSSRHTFATIALDLTGDIAVVGKFCGHAKLSTTEIYAKASTRSMINLTRLMDAM